MSTTRSPGFAKSRAREAATFRGQPAVPAAQPTTRTPGEESCSPDFVRRLLPFVAPFYRYYFRCEIRGSHRLPDRAAFLVANHNATGIVEVPLLIYGWYTRCRSGRPARGLAHDWLFQIPVIGGLLRRVGCVRATPEVARRTLEEGADLLVFPGGEWESTRPWRERGRISLGGRTGFVKTALETGAPVVPLVICGAHETVPILSRGAWIARLLGTDRRLRMKVSPVTLQTIAFVWKACDVMMGNSTPLTLPLYFLNTFILFPWLPSKIVMEFLDPIDLRAETAGAASHDERIRLGFELVRSRMQAAMDELQSERRTPWG